MFEKTQFTDFQPGLGEPEFVAAEPMYELPTQIEAADGQILQIPEDIEQRALLILEQLPSKTANIRVSTLIELLWPDNQLSTWGRTQLRSRLIHCDKLVYNSGTRSRRYATLGRKQDDITPSVELMPSNISPRETKITHVRSTVIKHTVSKAEKKLAQKPAARPFKGGMLEPTDAADIERELAENEIRVGNQIGVITSDNGNIVTIQLGGKTLKIDRNSAQGELLGL